MSRFPILLDLHNSKVLVAGSGHLAIAKIRLLLAAGANVAALTYRDNKIEKEFGEEIELIDGPFDEIQFEKIKLLYIADVSSETLTQLVKTAIKFNIPYNHVDDPDNSSFTTPAIVKRGPVTVSISTDGKAPVLSRNIRQKVEQLLPSDLGDLVNLLAQYRDNANQLITISAEKLKFWNRVYSDLEINRLLKLTLSNQRKRISKLISSYDSSTPKGHVQIVGSGPGDPELLTLKAHRTLQEANVIVYDNLVSKDILNLARRDAELIYVGKSRSNHSKTQDQINEIVIEHANKGLQVVRLKGGDPMIFGRVAEEIDALRKHKVSFEIIPGITSAVGIAAQCAIPLTHREYSSAITLATGQLKEDQTQNWRGMAGKGRTIAIYMGIRTAEATSSALIRDGFDADTPVAIIENGTRPNERRVYGTLHDLGKLVEINNIQSPALLIVGDVVAEADDFSLQEPSIFSVAE